MDLHDAAVAEIVAVRQRQRHREQLLLVQHRQLALQIQLVQAEDRVVLRLDEHVAPLPEHAIHPVRLSVSPRHSVSPRLPLQPALELDEMRLRVVDRHALRAGIGPRAHQQAVLEAGHALLLALQRVASHAVQPAEAEQTFAATHDQLARVGEARAAPAAPARIQRRVPTAAFRARLQRKNARFAGARRVEEKRIALLWGRGGRGSRGSVRRSVGAGEVQSGHGGIEVEFEGAGLHPFGTDQIALGWRKYNESTLME